jgi:hypothetical protein
LLDYIDAKEGFLYLRMVGPETAINAVWARLLNRSYRSDRIGSKVAVKLRTDQDYAEGVAAQRGVRYKTIRSDLPCGEVDLAMIHPDLTPAEDRPDRLLLISYQEGMPLTFFKRFQAILPLPIQEEWAPWLWEEGQKAHSFRVLQTRTVTRDGQEIEQPYLTPVSETPIQEVRTIGDVKCYQIVTSGYCQEAWLRIIRQKLNLGTRLAWIEGGKTGYHLKGDGWSCYETDEGDWALHQGQKQILIAPALEHFVVEARQKLGVNFIIEERN